MSKVVGSRERSSSPTLDWPTAEDSKAGSPLGLGLLTNLRSGWRSFRIMAAGMNTSWPEPSTWPGVIPGL